MVTAGRTHTTGRTAPQAGAAVAWVQAGGVPGHPAAVDSGVLQGVHHGGQVARLEPEQHQVSSMKCGLVVVR